MDNNGIFKYVVSAGEYLLAEYLQKENPKIKEIEISAEYNGQRVRTLFDHSFKGARYLEKVIVSEGITAIGKGAFAGSGLRFAIMPKSLLTVGEKAFSQCDGLERVTFKGNALLGANVFSDCQKISAEMRLMDYFHCTDLNFDSAPRPIQFSAREYDEAVLREDVLRLGVELGVFDEIDREFIIDGCVRHGLLGLLPIVEDWFDMARLKRYFTFSVETQNVEFTAYLLDIKRRKFGFGTEGFEL